MDKNKQIKSTEFIINESGWTISISLLGCMFFSYALSVVGFYIGISINEYIFPISVIGGILIGILINPHVTTHQRIIWIDIVLAIIATSLFLAGVIYDQSYDGIRYHQETIGALCYGWNPHRGNVGEYIPENLWPLHYAKAVEIVEASIVSFTGKMETGKSINLIMIISVFFGVFALLRGGVSNIFIKDTEQAKRWRPKKAFWIALAIVGNPVVLSQWMVYYIDFYKYIYLLIILLSFCIIGSSERFQRRRGNLMLGMSLVLAMGTKFNFFFEAGLWMILAFIWLSITKNYEYLKKFVIVSACALLIGGILAYHPYITNLIGYGHPFYPLMGEGAVDIMSGNTPTTYAGHNRITNFFISLFSITFPNYDQREGGFSVFMPIILLLSGIIAWKVRKSLRLVIWYVAVCIFLSCFIFEQTWWARYICQLWLVCGLFLVASLSICSAKKVGLIMYIFMALSGLLTITTSLTVSVVRGNYLRYLFQTCREAPVIVAGELPIQMRRHLDDEGIKYKREVKIPEEGMENAVYYYYGCEPIIYLSEDQIKHLDNKLRNIHQSVDRYRYVPIHENQRKDE